MILEDVRVIADALKYATELRAAKDRRSLKVINLKARLLKKYRKWHARGEITQSDLDEIIDNINAIDGGNV